MSSSLTVALAHLPDLPLAAGVPAWVWATLLMAAFIGVSVLTMWLVRFPLRHTPPPVSPPAEPAGSDEEDGDR